jgi:hypothetical protein
MQANNLPLITLTTDFGEQDGYVGIMRGVILTICPRASLVDLSHTVAPQDVRAAAFILYQSFNYFPPNTIHCLVVDPGVGSKRRAIAVRTNCGIFVGPDNGVFSLVLNAAGVNVMEAVTLTNPAYRLAEVSHTFHGRDIFAPAAAHLANGVPLAKFGPQAINLIQLDVVQKADNGYCRVMHIDHFGNLILNITEGRIRDPRTVKFTMGRQVIRSLHNTFADVQEGEVVAYVGSTKHHIEIAIRNGNAAQRLGVKVGDRVEFSEV